MLYILGVSIGVLAFKIQDVIQVERNYAQSPCQMSG